MANSKLTIKLKTDSGSSNSDWITNNGVMNISGALGGDKLYYQIIKPGDVISSSGWIATSGAVPAASTDGAWTVVVKEVTSAGGLVQTISQTYTLDRVALAPVVSLSSDTGISSSDGISKLGTLLVNAETGAKVQYSIDNGKTWSTTFTAKEGVNTVSVKQTDVAGNVSPSTKYSFTLDTVAPTTAPKVALQNDSSDGLSNHASDLITNNGMLTVTGLDANATTFYSVDGGINWSTSFSAKEGNNTLQVRQQDIAGNASLSNSISFTLDTQVAIPSLSLQQDSSDGKVGHNSDLITNNAALNIGALESGAQLQYSSNAGATWSNSFSAVEGVNTLSVRQLDIAGNLSNSAQLNFTLDTVAPLAANDTAGVLNNTSYILKVLANDGTDATLFQVDNLSVQGGTISVNADGGINYQSAAGFVGVDSFSYQVADAAGNKTTAQVSLNVSAPANGNLAPVVWDNPVAAIPVDSVSSITIDALAYAYDPDGTNLSVVLPAQLPSGVSFDAQLNSFVFNQSGYHAGDKVVVNYAISDGQASTPATATIYVTNSLPFTTVDAQQPHNLANALLGTQSGLEIDLGSIAFHASAAQAAHYYDGSLSALGIGSGLLLTSGTAPNLVNTVGWFGTDNSYDPQTGITNFDNGDVDLNAVVNTVFQTTSYDATTLSFDFDAADNAATSLSFNLVFGSDEYPEWVDQFVDAAIVMVNGQNVALFNHNAMSPLSVIGSNLAAGYFQDNTNSHLPIEYDGVSNVLTIVAPIHAGTNTIKIAIGDTGDHIYDSGIFIANFKAGYLSGSGVLIEDNSSTSGNDSIAGGNTSDLVNLGGGNDSLDAGGGDDIVDGGSGTDVITGGSGSDVLTGGSGADEFDYSNKNDWAAFDIGHMDHITDFAPNSYVLSNAANMDNINGDVLLFSYSDLNVLSGGGWAVELQPSANGFSSLTNQYVSQLTDGHADQAHGQFVYDASTGIVAFDVDGTGSQAALTILQLDNHISNLISSSLVVIA